MFEATKLNAFAMHLGGQFTIPLSSRRLILQSLQSSADFFDDVVQANHVLVDSAKSLLCLCFSRFESRNTRGFFEDRASVLGGRLQQSIHLALFNQTVCIDPDPGPTKQIPNIFQTARSCVDRILTFTAAINSPRDFDFVGIEFEDAGAVVENKGDFGAVGRFAPPFCRALENHIGHFRSAQSLGALGTKHPFDRIDDVRFARSVRTDHYGDSLREIEPRSIREAFETYKFQRL